MYNKSLSAMLTVILLIVSAETAYARNPRAIIPVFRALGGLLKGGNVIRNFPTIPRNVGMVENAMKILISAGAISKSYYSSGSISSSSIEFYPNPNTLVSKRYSRKEVLDAFDIVIRNSVNTFDEQYYREQKRLYIYNSRNETSYEHINRTRQNADHIDYLSIWNSHLKNRNISYTNRKSLINANKAKLEQLKDSFDHILGEPFELNDVGSRKLKACIGNYNNEVYIQTNYIYPGTRNTIKLIMNKPKDIKEVERFVFDNVIQQELGIASDLNGDNVAISYFIDMDIMASMDLDEATDITAMIGNQHNIKTRMLNGVPVFSIDRSAVYVYAHSSEDYIKKRNSMYKLLKTPIRKDRTYIIPITDELYTLDLIKKVVPQNTISFTNKESLERNLSKYTGITLVALGHIDEQGYFATVDNQPLLKISYLIDLCAKSNINLIVMGCESTRFASIGYIHGFRSPVAVKHFMEAIQEENVARFILKLSSDNMALVIKNRKQFENLSRIPMTDFERKTMKISLIVGLAGVTQFIGDSENIDEKQTNTNNSFNHSGSLLENDEVNY